MESRASHRTLYIILLAALLLRVPLLFRPAPQFHARPFIEDAYYSLSVARSIGHGQGITIDGRQATNGIQPLIVVMYAPFYAFFDDDTALRLCLALGIGIEILLAFALRRFILVSGKRSESADSAANIAVFLLLFSYSASVYTLNGLETALAAALMLLCAAFYARITVQNLKPTATAYAQLGALAGIAILARIDLSFAVAGLLIYHLFRKRTGVVPAITKLREASITGAVAGIVSSPWWLYNYLYFGSFTPTSGLSQRAVIPVAENLNAAVQFCLNRLLLIGYLPYTRRLTAVHFAILGAALAALASILLAPRLRKWAMSLFRELKTQWRARPAMPIVIAVLLMGGYYIFNFGAPHFFARYLFPATVLWFAFIGAVMHQALLTLQAKRPAIAHIVRTGGIVSIIAVFALPYSWNYSYDRAKQNNFLSVSEYISRRIPTQARIGMGQSGTAGYFNANVANLDGKVNYNVFRVRRERGLCAYLDSAQFDYLIDWQHFFDAIDSCTVLQSYSRIDSVGRFLVYRRTRE